ncbi:unnamed protein product, partial [Tetraodon nigroviridis]
PSFQGCDPLTLTQRSKLQHRRARINQQINKEMRMRAGAENLFRATTNSRVKQTVALELSFVNSNLQLLKEELEELNSNMEVYQTDSETINVPMIPLGLKETKEVDFTLPIQVNQLIRTRPPPADLSVHQEPRPCTGPLGDLVWCVCVPLQDVLCEHYGEDSSGYNQEIQELMELRQAMRTPSRNQAGLELLMEYYNQLYYLDQRFFPLHGSLGVHFHCARCRLRRGACSSTSVPCTPRWEPGRTAPAPRASTRLWTPSRGPQYPSAGPRARRVTSALLLLCGGFHYLRENFSNAPSLDMSGPSLCMLVRLMVAQVQECVFERLTLTTADTRFTSQLRLAQEAARVSEVYLLVQQSMAQPLMKDYVPFSWASMVQVKSEHFRALSHYHAAVALCQHTRESAEEEEVEEEEEEEKAFLHFYVSVPTGPPLSQILHDPEKRRKLGKAHLRRAVIRHEEALRLHGLCRILRKMDLLQDVLALTHKRSLDMYSELDREDDFDETAELRRSSVTLTQQKADITPPDFSTVQVTDIFHKLEAGLREGDYIVAVDGQDCKWAKHAEVVHLLKNCSAGGVELSVVTLHSHDTQVERRAAALARSKDKENTRQHHLGGAKGQSSASLLNWNRKKKRESSGGAKSLGSTFSLPFGSIRDAEAMY